MYDERSRFARGEMRSLTLTELGLEKVQTMTGDKPRSLVAHVNDCETVDEAIRWAADRFLRSARGGGVAPSEQEIDELSEPEFIFPK